jgi:1-acyl-sn-glycerol-3-phosphate acyltransferase
MRDFVYPVVIAAAKTWFKVGDVRIVMSGTENIPLEGGALLAVNHLSFVDYVLAGYPGVQRGRLTRFIAKKEVFDHPVGGPVMRSFHHIAIDRNEGQAGMDEARRYLDAGELVGIFPEGTISRSFELQPLKTGAVRIAADAGVPLIPIVLWGTQRFLTKGKPRDFGRHKTVAIEVGTPLHPTPADNSAPTPEEAAAMYAEERRQRAQKRAQRRARRTSR